MPRVLLPIYYRVHNPDLDDLILAILIHAGDWSLIGAAAAFAFIPADALRPGAEPRPPRALPSPGLRGGRRRVGWVSGRRAAGAA